MHGLVCDADCRSAETLMEKPKDSQSTRQLLFTHYLRKTGSSRPRKTGSSRPNLSNNNTNVGRKDANRFLSYTPSFSSFEAPAPSPMAEFAARVQKAPVARNCRDSMHMEDQQTICDLGSASIGVHYATTLPRRLHACYCGFIGWAWYLVCHSREPHASRCMNVRLCDD